MTHTAETDHPNRPIPSPGKILAWATAPATAAIALTSWLVLRPPPAPWHVSLATVCVVAAGATGALLLAALVLTVAKLFADRYDTTDDRATAHQKDMSDRLARMEDRQVELASHLIDHGVEIARINDSGQTTSENTRRIAQGLEDLREAYIEEGVPVHRRAA